MVLLGLLLTSLALTGGGINCGSPENPEDVPPNILPALSNLSPAEADAMIQANVNNPDFIIIDVRTALEFLLGHIAGAINADVTNPTSFTTIINSFTPDKTYLVYCQKGNRVQHALTMMSALGFKNIYNLEGGLARWKQEGYPVVLI